MKKTIFICLLAALMCGCSLLPAASRNETPADVSAVSESAYPDIPAYSSEPYTVINGDIPFFAEEDFSLSEGDIVLSDFDAYGRAGKAVIMAGPSTYQDGERGPTGTFKPTGWHQNKYPGLVDSEPPYLFNRGHLLMWALSGLTDEEKNLITVTRYMNTEGMLSVEMEILRYIRRTDHRVLYRVTPVFFGDELLSRGVLMEAKDPEGDFCLCRFAYNVQPGVYIDYETGENRASS